MEWITKRKSGGNGNGDVTITKIKSKSKPKYSIRFRNGSHLSISKNKKMIYAFAENRIYFKEGNELEGFTMGDFSIDNKICAIQVTLMNNKFLGDYALKYDGAEKLYYIDADARLK